MNGSADDKHVRRIVLPSGRTIEVVRFPEEGATETRPLHICPVCASRLVLPVEWQEAGEGRWELTLRCPNCEWRGNGTYNSDQLLSLEEELDQGLRDLIGDLRQLTFVNMRDEVERFSEALQADLILPEDF